MVVLAILCSTVGVALPTLQTLKLLRSIREGGEGQTEVEEAQMNRWLEFWAVRSLWELMHQLGIARIMGIHRDSMLSLIFYAWILAPQLKGAEKVYKWIVEPMMDKHGADVDEQIMRAKTHTKDIIEAWVLKFIQIARVGAAHILRQAHAAIANMDSQKS